MPTVNSDVTVNIDVEVEIYCANCGAGLCNQSKSGNTRGRNQAFIEVTPCEKCLETAKNEGYEEGIKELGDPNESPMCP
jgi:hypothetical protein